MTVYSLRDVKAGVYGSVFAEMNDNTAIRNVSVLVNNPQAGLIHSHPEDFELFAICAFNVESGDVENTEHRFVKSCVDMLSQ